jgi:hypothetical protein
MRSMRTRIVILLLTWSLLGCGEEFRRNQERWNAHLNSRDYGARYYSHTVTTPQGQTTCDTIARRDGRVLNSGGRP